MLSIQQVKSILDRHFVVGGLAGLDVITFDYNQILNNNND